MKNLFKKNNCHANIKFVERTFTIHFNYNFLHNCNLFNILHTDTQYSEEN